MPYSTDDADYDERDLFRVAEEYFVHGKSHEQIVTDLNIRPRAKVVAMCQAAKRAGMVRVTVMPASSENADRLHALAQRVRARFGLLDCVLVSGRREMLDGDLPRSYVETIVEDIARQAAALLERQFRVHPGRHLAVTFGFMARKIADAIPMRPIRHDDACQNTVVAAHGVRRQMLDRFGANAIARDMAHNLGCSYASFPMPVLIPKDAAPAESILRKWDLVKETWDLIENSNMVVSAVRGLNQHSHDSNQGEAGEDSPQVGGADDKPGTARKQEIDLLRPSKSELAIVGRNGGIGEIGGRWFDRDGNDVRHPSDMQFLGMELKLLRDLVGKREPVMLASGATIRRIPALYTALTCQRPLANVWVGDDVTARVLLGDWEVPLSISELTESEKELFRAMRRG